jgi:DNA-binding NarL/FixJ family response regulator
VQRRILIVDDHPSFRASARMILEADGFEVVGEAEDAASCCRAARELQPDVVLLDIQLPDGDGFSICARLCAPPAPAVVLVSSRDASDYGDRIAKCGARGFIPKAELSGAALAELLG